MVTLLFIIGFLLNFISVMMYFYLIVVGTPPRLDKRTIDFSSLPKLDPDVPPTPFSFLNRSVNIQVLVQCKKKIM